MQGITKVAVAAILMSSVTDAHRLHHHHHHAKNVAENSKYEPEWGHNSGNSYNNGPTDHFYHGKASPYSVTKEDVQITEIPGTSLGDLRGLQITKITGIDPGDLVAVI